MGAVATRDRVRDRGRARALRMRTALGNDLLGGRREHDVSQTFVASAVGVLQSYYSRIERGLAPGVTLEQLAIAFEVLGMDLTARAYPAGQPLRDAPQLRLLADLRTRIHSDARWLTEVALAMPGDQRSWDAIIRVNGIRIGVEAETRLRDVQAVQRRIGLKKRDDSMDRVILLLRATRTNHSLVRAFTAELRTTFPVTSNAALDALA